MLKTSMKYMEVIFVCLINLKLSHEKSQIKYLSTIKWKFFESAVLLKSYSLKFVKNSLLHNLSDVREGRKDVRIYGKFLFHSFS